MLSKQGVGLTAVEERRQGGLGCNAVLKQAWPGQSVQVPQPKSSVKEVPCLRSRPRLEQITRSAPCLGTWGDEGRQRTGS